MERWWIFGGLVTFIAGLIGALVRLGAGIEPSDDPPPFNADAFMVERHDHHDSGDAGQH